MNAITASPLQTTELTAVAAGLLADIDAALADLLSEERRRWRASDPSLEHAIAALEAFLDGGKRLRPAFAVLGYLGARGVPNDTEIIRLGVALELLHAFALIHDDVMDDSDTRRGRPSLHRQFSRPYGSDSAATRFGEGMAILVGDLAHMLAERALCDSPAEVRLHWYAMQVELTRGQALDLEAGRFGKRISEEQALRIARLKSGRYSVVRPLQLGALAASCPPLLDAYAAFGEPLGEAFQLRDDLLGVFGNPGVTGKPVGDDLREGKPTFLLACTRRRVTDADRRLLEQVGRPDLDVHTTRRLQRLIEACGARAEVEARIVELEATAHDALQAAPIAEDARAALHALADATVWRAT
jgi:geranylgeranyl diphosphate synthase type I